MAGWLAGVIMLLNMSAEFALSGCNVDGLIELFPFWGLGADE